MPTYVTCRHCGQEIDARGMRMHEPWCKKQPKEKRGERPSIKRKRWRKAKVQPSAKRDERPSPKKKRRSTSAVQPLAPPKEKSLDVQVAELKLTVSYARDMLMLVTKTLSNLGV